MEWGMTDGTPLDADILSTIEASVQSAVDGVEDTADEAEVTTEETETPDASSEGAPADVEADTDTEDESETQAEASAEGTDDVPVEYFGVDLSDLPAEARQGIIDGFKERDILINKLLRDKGDEQPEGTPSPEQETQPTDEPTFTDADILAQLKLDPENDPFDEHTAKVALPLAKAVMEMRQQLAELQNNSTLQETDRYWRTSLKALEESFGELPVDAEAVMQFAAANDVGDPQDAYWRIMGPAREQLVKAAAERRAEATRAAKQAATTQRPKTAAKTTPARIEGEEVGDVLGDAAKAAAEELGLDWNALTERQ